LEANGYEYILEAKIKNEREKIKEKILATEFSDGMTGEHRKIRQYQIHSELFSQSSQKGCL